MIRWVTEGDRLALTALLTATEQVPLAYSVENLDGWWMVDERTDGGLRGAVRWEWGRPECWVHVLTVAPDAQRRMNRSAWQLMHAVAELARAYGAQGLAGFARADRPAAPLYQRAGATLEPGFRVRWNLIERRLL